MKLKRIYKHKLPLMLTSVVILILVIGLLILAGPLKIISPVKAKTYSLAVNIGNTTDGDSLDQLTDFSVSKSGYAAVVNGNLNFYSDRGKLLWSKTTNNPQITYSHVVTDDNGIIVVQNSYPAYSQSNTSGDATSQLLSGLQALTNSLTPTPTIIKYDFTGKEKWSTKLPPGLSINSLAFSNLEGIYATSTFKGTIAVGNQSYSSLGQNNVLLIFLSNVSGSVNSSIQVGSDGDDSAQYILPNSELITAVNIGGSGTQVVDSQNFRAQPTTSKGSYIGNFTPNVSNGSPYEFFRAEPNLLAYTDNKIYEQQVVPNSNPAELYVLTGGPDTSLQQPNTSSGEPASINNVAIQTLDANGDQLANYPLANLVQNSSPDTNTTFLINTNNSKVYVVAESDIYVYRLANLQTITRYTIPRFHPFKTFAFNNGVYLAGYQYPVLTPGQSVQYTVMKIYRIY